MSAPLTSPTLLQRLRSPQDAAAWERFVELYTPLLLRYVRTRVAGEADAYDVVQEMMRRVFLALPRFDYHPERARFRSWLFRVAENQVRQWQRSRRRKPPGDGGTTLMQAAEAAAAEESEAVLRARWEREYQRRLFAWAAERVEPQVTPRLWRAFWRTAVEDEDPEAVARDLNMSRAAVYMARSRCVQRLRDCIAAAGAEEFDVPEETAGALTADD